MDVARLTAVVVWEDGVYVAQCPEVGTASQGRTVEEAVANLKEATELYLEDARLPVGRPPVVTSFEVDVAAGA
jgi:predicted RNase H-like HicB family nuclease